MWKAISENWERVLFAIVGLGCLYYSFDFLRAGKVTEAAAIFAIAFFSFIYSNFARFKRFKGLGFEAELWEDKQREAADLIDRLKSVVSVYTREIIVGKVTSGRWGGSGGRWRGHWKLYDELVHEHSALGQDIDFSEIKNTVDRYFLFDITTRLCEELDRQFRKASIEAQNIVKSEFTSVVTDTAGYNIRHEQLRSIEFEKDDLFEKSGTQNIARLVLNSFAKSQKALKDFFGINLEADQETLDRLAKVAELYDNRPVAVTAELINWADRGRRGDD